MHDHTLFGILFIIIIILTFLFLYYINLKAIFIIIALKLYICDLSLYYYRRIVHHDYNLIGAFLSLYFFFNVLKYSH